jgi:hypothetical protein
MKSKTASACKYCTKWRSCYRSNVGDLIILKRQLIRPRPKDNDHHTHISLYKYDAGRFVNIVTNPMLILAIVLDVALFRVIAAPKIIYHDLFTITLATISIIVQVQGFVYSYKGNPKPSYGKALSSLYRARASSECASLQKQYLNDAALELYSIGSCKRTDFLKLLEWINCRDRTTQEFTEFGEKLIEFFCEHHGRYQPTHKIGHTTS